MSSANLQQRKSGCVSKSEPMVAKALPNVFKISALQYLYRTLSLAWFSLYIMFTGLTTSEISNSSMFVYGTPLPNESINKALDHASNGGLSKDLDSLIKRISAENSPFLKFFLAFTGFVVVVIGFISPQKLIFLLSGILLFFLSLPITTMICDSIQKKSDTPILSDEDRKNKVHWGFYSSLVIGILGGLLTLCIIKLASFIAGAAIGYGVVIMVQLQVQTSNETYLKAAQYLPYAGAVVGGLAMMMVRTKIFSAAFFLIGSIIFMAGIDLFEIESIKKYYPTGFGSYFICLLQRSQECAIDQVKTSVYVMAGLVFVLFILLLGLKACLFRRKE